MHRNLSLLVLLCGFPLIINSQSHDLQYYINEGIRNSPLLKEYRNRINTARADSLLIKAGQKPQLEARSQLQYSPVYQNWGYDEVITDGGNYLAMMGVSQPILNKRTINNRYQSLEIEKQIINNSGSKSESELKKLITDQYLAACTTQSDLQFNQTFLSLNENEMVLVKALAASGTFRQTDYLSLLIETQSQEVLVSQLKSQLRKDLILLNEVCGINDTAVYELTLPQIHLSGVPDVENSASFRLYRIDSGRIENEKLANDLRYKPKINWFADAGFLTSNPWNFYRHFGYSAGVSLSVPVYDGRQREIEKQKLELEENTRQAYQASFGIKYYQQIDQLKEELQSLNETSGKLEKQLAVSEELLKALKAELESGIVQMTDYINAIRNYRTIRRNLNIAGIQKLQVINEINYLITQ